MVDAFQVHGVLVEHVEERGAHQVAEDLRGARRPLEARLARLGLGGPEARGDGEDPVSPEVNRGSEGRGQADASIAVPLSVDLDRREEQGESRRSEDVVHLEVGPDAVAKGPLPVPELPPGGEGDRLAGGVSEGDQGDGLEPAGVEVGLDPGQVLSTEGRLEEAPQRRAVDHPIEGLERRRPADREAHPDTGGAVEQREAAGLEDRVHVDAPPERLEFLGGRAEVRLAVAEVGGVDRSRRNTGQDGGVQRRVGPAEPAEDADLVRRAGAASEERQGEAVFLCALVGAGHRVERGGGTRWEGPGTPQ